MRLRENTACSTYSLNGLDSQIMACFNKFNLGVMSDISKIDGVVLSGPHVHRWLQASAAAKLEKAIQSRGKEMIINSALRTIAGQQLLRQHYENGQCGIMAAARPGLSNHNNATAIDIEDSAGWRSHLQTHYWHWIGDFDPMHYEFRNGVLNTVPMQIKAFQYLWNLTHPHDLLALDGNLGPATLGRLKDAPIEGWPHTVVEWLPPRILRLTKPCQIGQDVKDLQLAIRKAGVRINYDGLFGSDTDRAVKEYQKLQGMVADGIVGTQTQKKIIFKNA